jgi:hypothetical protein
VVEQGTGSVRAQIATRRALLLLPGLALAAAMALPAPAAICAIDPVPGATLLYPLFELDLAAPTTNDTVISVQNVSDSPVIAHVTFWTDWAVPVLGFDVYLAGFDVQTIDVKDVILDGVLPVTGRAVSPHGALSGAPVSFSNCNNGTTPGIGPVYQNPALSAFFRGQLQAALTGLSTQIYGGCAGSDRDNDVARGYVTVDANGACSLMFPSTAGYFSPAGPATRRNVLAGDLTLLRPDAEHAISFPAVALEAMPEGQPVPGGRTFYGRYTSGSGDDDGREPLPGVFTPRYLGGGAFDAGTDFFVWRETTSSAATGVSCGQEPAWAPLATAPVAVFDETENVTDVSQPFPIALDVVDTSTFTPFFFGFAVLDLQNAGATQAWVGWVSEASNRFAASVPAASSPVSCTP